MTDDKPNSPDHGAPAADEPLELTDDEVSAMAGRRAKAAPIVRRLKAHRRSSTTGRLVTDKQAPPRITAKQMASIRRGRRSTAAVRAGYAESPIAADAVTEPPDGKARPDRSPAPRAAP